MVIKNVNVIINTPVDITYDSLKTIINHTNSNLYTFIGDVFKIPDVNKVFSLIFESKFLFRIEIDEYFQYVDFEDIIVKSKSNIEFFHIKISSFTDELKILLSFLEKKGIKYYYSFEFNKDDVEILNRGFGSPSWFHLSIEKNKEEYKGYFDLLSKLEKELDFVITDKDTYLLKEPQFDCENYSDENITILSNGDVILCPCFSEIDKCKKSANFIGNLFELGLDRIISRSKEIKKLNSLIAKKFHNKESVRECDVCFSYIKK